MVRLPAISGRCSSDRDQVACRRRRSARDPSRWHGRHRSLRMPGRAELPAGRRPPAWQAKRLRNNPHVQVAASNGKGTGPRIHARATLLAGEHASIAANGRFGDVGEQRLQDRLVDVRSGAARRRIRHSARRCGRPSAFPGRAAAMPRLARTSRCRPGTSAAPHVPAPAGDPVGGDRTCDHPEGRWPVNTSQSSTDSSPVGSTPSRPTSRPRPCDHAGNPR